MIILGRRYHCEFRWGFSLLWLGFFILLNALGVWQLYRYQDKKILLATYQQRLLAKPTPLVEPALQFQHLALKGHYLNSLTMLVENRPYQDKIGFEVLTPLAINGQQQVLLIDRGWLPKTNQALPTIPTVSGEQEITGHVKLLNEYQFVLGKNILQPHSFPLVMQKIDINDIMHSTQRDFYPFILRLDQAAPHGYVRDWVITAMPPARHMAYAVQWFVMALVLLVAYLSFCCTRIDSKKVTIRGSSGEK